MNTECIRELKKNELLLCAVSGGADSMCLLHMLYAEGYHVAAAHFEHGIRGEESLRDETFVESWCREKGIPFRCGHGNVPAYAAENKLSIEEAGRKLRYEFLIRTAKEMGASRILTAHNLDDNAETMLFNLTRGAGIAGLRGIPRENGIIVRPLLQTSRTEIEAYLKRNHVPHVEDSTNQNEQYTRNLIRRRIMPLLHEINPQFSEAAARTGYLAEQDEDCLRAMAEAFIEKELINDSISQTALRRLHYSVASRVIRILYPGLSMERCQAVLEFIKKNDYGLLEIPGHTLVRDQGRLYLHPHSCSSIPDRHLVLGSSLQIPELNIQIDTEECIYHGEIHDLFKTSFIKYEIVSDRLLCTGRHPGDSIRPYGRGVGKRLSALFKEAGYNRSMRETCLMLRDGDGLLLARGLAIDERAFPHCGDRAWKISFKNMINEM